MGYNTKFSGELLFKNPLSSEKLNYINNLFGICIDKGQEKGNWVVIDLEFNEDLTGIRWDGSEKTHMLEESINFIIDKVGRYYSFDFELTGEIKAQGEEIGDGYIIKIENNRAIRLNTAHMCPSCGHEFRE